MLITTILLILLLIAFVQHDNRPLYEKHELCNVVKYIAALLVVHGHIFLFGLDNNSWTPEMNLGAQCVSVFFFFSGYGLMCSYQKKGDAYLHGFLTKRLGRILIPLLTAYALYIPVYYFTTGPIDPIEVVTRLCSAGPFLKFSWYVSEIFILYLLFFAAFKITTSNFNKAIILSILTIAMMAILFCLPDTGTYWIYSTPCFILGLWYQQYEPQIINRNCLTTNHTNPTNTLVEEKISKISEIHGRKEFLVVIIALALFAILFRFDLTEQLLPFLHRWRYEYASFFLVNIVLMTAVIYILQNYKPLILKQLGGGKRNCLIINSFYEVYLNQAAAFSIAHHITDNKLYYWLLAMSGSIITGYLMYFIDTMILNKIYSTKLQRIRPI